MIISLRGTNGSGKSYLVKKLMQRYDATPHGEDRRGKPLGYTMMLGNGSTLCLVGRYDIACGGCDSIQPYDDIWPRVELMYTLGDHVLFEGALVSSGYGRIGIASEAFGDDFVFTFLDTPLQTCIDNIQKRRESRGKGDKPMTNKTKKNVAQKMRAVDLSIINIRQNHKRRILILDHRKAIPQLLGFLYTGGKC